MKISKFIKNSWVYSVYRRAKTRARRSLHFYSGCNAPLHRGGRIGPFFIIGSGRAGTTLLRRILQSSPEVHIPPEIWSFKKTYNYFLKYKSILPWEDLVTIVSREYIIGGNFDREFQYKLLPIFRELVEIPTEDRTLAVLIDTINRAHGNHRDATFSRWGDKTPINSFCLNEILDVYPDAKFIHMIRDPADVVHSYLKHDLQPDLESGADRWRRAVRSVEGFKKRCGNVYDIYYEEFVEDTESEMRSICNFIDINFRSKWLKRTDHFNEIDEVAGLEHHVNVFDPISSEHVGKGRREMSEEQLDYLDTLVRKECITLGYDSIV
jgi:hypothetical protein